MEDAASVLAEPTDLAHSLLDPAELEGEEPDGAPREGLEEGGEEGGEVFEVAAAFPPAGPGRSEDGMDPEELEERMEEMSEAAEAAAFHDEEPLREALLDEGVDLEGFAQDEVDDALEARGAAGLELSGAGTEHFRARLQEEKARLESLAADFEQDGLRERSVRDDLSALSAVDQHPADQGTETFLRERDLSIREQVEGELAEVEDALARLAAGSFGACQTCGRPIGWARLDAQPTARFCVAHQHDLEHPGPPRGPVARRS